MHEGQEKTMQRPLTPIEHTCLHNHPARKDPLKLPTRLHPCWRQMCPVNTMTNVASGKRSEYWSKVSPRATLCCMQSFLSVSFIHTYHAGAMNEVKDFILLGDASKSGINTLIQLCVKLLFMTASALRQERAEGLHEIRIIFNCEQRNKIPIIKI